MKKRPDIDLAFEGSYVKKPLMQMKRPPRRATSRATGDPFFFIKHNTQVSKNNMTYTMVTMKEIPFTMNTTTCILFIVTIVYVILFFESCLIRQSNISNSAQKGFEH